MHHDFSLPPNREELQIRMSPLYSFPTLLSPTFKYTAEVPKFVSRFNLRSVEAAISRELSTDVWQNLYLLEMQVFTDSKGSTSTSAESLSLVE